MKMICKELDGACGWFKGKRKAETAECAMEDDPSLKMQPKKFPRTSSRVTRRNKNVLTTEELHVLKVGGIFS